MSKTFLYALAAVTSIGGGLYAMGASLATSKPLEQVFTDVAACQSDAGMADSLKIHCEGPSQVDAALIYIEGKVFLQFGDGAIGDIVNPYNAGDAYILAGNDESLFGEKIEWTLGSNGRPCAATLRVSTEDGSRLVVTSMGGGGRAGIVETNDEARDLSADACERFGEAPAPVDVVKMKYSIVSDANPVMESVWGEYFADAVMPADAEEIYGYFAEYDAPGGRKIQVTSFPDMIQCTMRDCPTAVLVDGAVVQNEHMCLPPELELEFLSDGSAVRICDKLIRL